MENPRPEKVQVVDEVRERLEATSAALLTEYRGLTVGQMATLRTRLRAAGGEISVYKNTLIRFAARDLGLEIDELLTGPTAIAFVTEKPSGDPGDAVDVAKVLKDFGREFPALVVKGGVLGDRRLDADDAKALADVEPREVLLAKLAGAMAAPMQQFAGLLQALPRNMAYGLKALIDQGGAPGAPASPAADAETVAEAAAEADIETEAPAPAVAEVETPNEDVAEQTPAASEDTPSEENQES